jgi:hypothetical protein
MDDASSGQIQAVLTRSQPDGQKSKSDHSGCQNLGWPDSGEGGQNPATMTGRFWILAPARFWWWLTAWTWRSTASFKRWSNASVVCFLKFTLHILSNENNFLVDYYFLPYQTLKNAEIILRWNKRSIREIQGRGDPLSFHKNSRSLSLPLGQSLHLLAAPSHFF